MDPSSLARGRPNQPHYNYVLVGGANLYLTDCCTLTRINGKKGAKSEDMAVESTEVGADESRCIEDGALYLVEDRLETFKESHWPFDSGPCTALKVRLLMMSSSLSSPSILISHVYDLEVFLSLNNFRDDISFHLYAKPCASLHRWQKRASITVAQLKLQTGYVVLSVIKIWRAGSPRTILGESVYYLHSQKYGSISYLLNTTVLII